MTFHRTRESGISSYVAAMREYHITPILCGVYDPVLFLYYLVTYDTTGPYPVFTGTLGTGPRWSRVTGPIWERKRGATYVIREHHDSRAAAFSRLFFLGRLSCSFFLGGPNAAGALPRSTHSLCLGPLPLSIFPSRGARFCSPSFLSFKRGRVDGTKLEAWSPWLNVHGSGLDDGAN